MGAPGTGLLIVLVVRISRDPKGDRGLAELGDEQNREHRFHSTLKNLPLGETTGCPSPGKAPNERARTQGARTVQGQCCLCGHRGGR